MSQQYTPSTTRARARLTPYDTKHRPLRSEPGFKAWNEEKYLSLWRGERAQKHIVRKQWSRPTETQPTVTALLGEKQPKKKHKREMCEKIANLPSLWWCGRTKKNVKHRPAGFTVVVPTVLISEWVYRPALVVAASLHPDPPSSPLGCGKSAQDETRYWRPWSMWLEGDKWLVLPDVWPASLKSGLGSG